MINGATRTILKTLLWAIVGLSMTHWVTGCALLERHDDTYKTYEEALADGAIGKRGMLPAYIPESATNIRVCFDVDTQETWARFHFEKADFLLLVRCSEEVSPADIIYPWPGSTRWVRWWPKDLRSPPTRLKSRYRFYQCDPDTAFSHWPQPGFVAVSEDTTCAWFWRRSPAWHRMHPSL
jgi:hypothetical protein